MLAVKTISGFFGSTFTSAKSDSRDARVGRHLVEVLAGVVRSIQPVAARRADGREHARRHRGRDRDADASEAVLLEGRNSLADLTPGVAAVGRLEHPAARAGKLSVF